MHTPWKKEWEMFPTVLAYYEISFALKDHFQRSFNPKIGLYVAVLLTYLYRREQHKVPTVLPFQPLCKIRFKLTVMIMGSELFRSGGSGAWTFWLDLVVRTPMWVKRLPLSVGQGSRSLQLCYRVLVNLPFYSTNQGSISPTLLKNIFSSSGPQTFLRASLALAPFGIIQPACKPLREWQLHFQAERMSCLKQQVSFNELKSCTQPAADRIYPNVMG